MLWWIRQLFATYRHEGIPQDETCEERILRVADLEPYVHPFEIPGNHIAVNAMYGNPGDVKLSRAWERSHMVLVKGLPGSWNNGKGRIYCHRKMVPAVRELFRRCEAYGILDEVKTLGCFNYRVMKSNSARLSHHSRGVALDVNHADNRGRFYARGDAPEPWSERWRSTWPNGISMKLVQAFKECGFRWGGDWNTYKDPMHFELVHIHREVTSVLPAKEKLDE